MTAFFCIQEHFRHTLIDVSACKLLYFIKFIASCTLADGRQRGTRRCAKTTAVEKAVDHDIRRERRRTRTSDEKKEDAPGQTAKKKAVGQDNRPERWSCDRTSGEADDDAPGQATGRR